MDGNIMNILTMILVGIICGSLAGFITRGNNGNFIANALLGIAGAIVGGFIFDKLGITPGAGIVKSIDQTFGVQLPRKFVGMIFSGTVGAILIIMAARLLRGGKLRK